MVTTPAPFGPPANARETTILGIADWLAGCLSETEQALDRVLPEHRADAEHGAASSLAARMQSLGHPVAIGRDGTRVEACGVVLFSWKPFDLDVFRAWPDFARTQAITDVA